MLKKISSILIALAILVTPTIAGAQLNVNQGGTGRTSFTGGDFLYANSDAFQRITGTSTPSFLGFFFTNATGTNATTSSLFSTVGRFTNLYAGSLSGILKATSGLISDAVSNTDYQAPITLTTTGSSGAATFNGTTLNIPTYAGGTISTSTALSSGQVVFSTGVNTIGNSSSFFWNNTNKWLGIGTAAPTANLVVSKSYAEPTGGIASSTVAVLSNNNVANGTSTLSILARSSAPSTINFGSQLGERSGYIDYQVGAASPYIANTMRFGTGGTDRMVIDGNGNVGIGTTSPSSKLHVVGSIQTDSGSDFITASNFRPVVSGGALRFYSSNGTTELMQLANTGNLSLGTTTQPYRFYAYTPSTALAWFDHGVSTTQPVIIGSSANVTTNTGLYLRTTGTATIQTGATAKLVFVDGADTNMVIDGSTGFLGVGTTSPYKLLSVGGDAVIGAATAGGTPGDLYLPKLGTPAGSFIAVDASGKVIATSTPSGVSSVSATYPVISSGGSTPTISLAFGTTTSNTWAGTQTFNNTVTTNATTTTASFTTASTTNAYVSSLATAAGTFVAADPNGKLIATTTPSSGSTSSSTVQVFTSTGANTWNKPAGLKWVIVEVQGGGSSGTSSGGANHDASGAGGGYAKKLIPAASLGSTETVTVGSGGSAPAVNTNGNAGSASSFGSHCSANGGTAPVHTGAGGVGGTATGGDVNIAGQSGHEALSSGSGFSIGGSSQLGRGGISKSGGSNANGTGYGAGGAAAANSNTPGAGTQGIVIVTEFY